MSEDISTADTLALQGLKNREQVDAAPIHATIRIEPNVKLWLERDSFPVIEIADDSEDATSLFSLVEQLGEGGAGAVFLARQPTLDRDVAIKFPLGAQDSPDVHLLLREARIMGYLEHPGIVPIHLVARDTGAKPFVVMKRIEGQTFEERLEATSDPLEQLDANLDVVIDVCHALSYAHSRGIVHRDIKPANIMTGAFGEVYLLDWGVAVAFRDDVPSTIPRQVPDQLVGTPAYMAPEMASMNASHGPRTDVYLMGALLYSVLTAKAPHEGGGSPWAALFKAQQSEPKTFPEEVPRRLAEICNRAMARDPEDRFESVDAFRQAIVDVREHEAAQELADSGVNQAAQLKAALDSGEADDARIYAIFGAARQTLEESLRLWPGCTSARRALQEALELIIEFELGRDNPLGAQRFLEELPCANEVLSAQVHQAVAEHRRQQAELEAFRHQMDPRVAGRTKAKVWIGIGLAIGVPQLIPPMIGMPLTAQMLVEGHIIMIALVAVLFVIFRRRLLSTRANRILATAVWLPIMLNFFLRLGLLFGQGTIAFALAIDVAFVALLGLYLAINVDRRLFIAVPGYVIGACVTLAFPDYAAWIFPLTHLLSLSALGIQHLIEASSMSAASRHSE